MTTLSYSIRPISADDQTQWRTLWAAYCAFYDESVSEDTTQTLWHRLHDSASTINGLVAVGEDSGLLGFAHYILHPHTWSEKTLCYLEDLFVTPEARGRRIAPALIEHLVQLGRENDWRRIYWHTHTHNETARRVYDRFAPADDFVRYTISLG